MNTIKLLYTLISLLNKIHSIYIYIYFNVTSEYEFSANIFNATSEYVLKAYIFIVTFEY